VTIHVCIENAASKAVDAATKLSFLKETDSIESFSVYLKEIIASLREVNKIFSGCQKNVTLMFIITE